jgi:TolA-binding protein
VSVLERAITAIKDVLLLRDQFRQMREEVNRMGGNMNAMLDDIRDLEQRMARLEGFVQGAAAAGTRRPKLPKD